MRGERSGLVFLAILVILWGGNYTWVKIALADTGPLMFNAIRYCAAALLMMAAFGLGGRFASIMPVSGERWPLALIGLLQIAGVTTLTAFALKRIDASPVVLIIYSLPIWTVLFGALLLRQRASARTLIGIAAGGVGLALLTNPWTMRWTPDAPAGIAFALASVIAWALGSVLYRARTWTSGLWSQIFWQIAVTGIVTVPLALLFEGVNSFNPTPSLLIVIAYNTIGPSVLGYWCWSQALIRVPVTSASQFLLLSPVYGVFQNWIVLHEPITAATWAAAMLILVGAFLSLPAKRAEG